MLTFIYWRKLQKNVYLLAVEIWSVYGQSPNICGWHL